MTLDEAINSLIKDKMCNETPIETCVKKPCPECDCYSIIELKDLLPVLSDAKKELEVYKKALESACEAIVDRDCTGGIACCKNNCELYEPCSNEIGWKEYFIQKARAEV